MPDKTLMKWFVPTLLFLVLFGCSSKPTDTEFKLSIGNQIIGGSAAQGGLAIWAHNTTSGQKFAHTFMGVGSSVDVPYPPGNYNFSIVAWDGDGNLDGDVADANEPMALMGEAVCSTIGGISVGGSSMTLNVNLSNANCDNQTLSAAPGIPVAGPLGANDYENGLIGKAVYGTTPKKFNNPKFNFCKDFYANASGIDVNNLAPCVNSENSQINVKITLMNMAPGGGPTPGIQSRCFIGGGTGITILGDANGYLNIPWGSLNTPVLTKVELFTNETSNDCDDTNEPLVFNDGPPPYMLFYFQDGIGHPSPDAPEILYTGTNGDAQRDLLIAFNGMGAGKSVFRDEIPYTQCNGNDCATDSTNTYVASMQKNASAFDNGTAVIPAEAYVPDATAVTACSIATQPAVDLTLVATWNNADDICEITVSGSHINGTNSEDIGTDFNFFVQFTDGATNPITPSLKVYVMQGSPPSNFYSAQKIKGAVWDLTGVTSGRSVYDEFCFGNRECHYANNHSDTTVDELRDILGPDGIGGLLHRAGKYYGFKTCGELSSYVVSNGAFTFSDYIEEENGLESIFIYVYPSLVTKPSYMGGGNFELDVLLNMGGGLNSELISLDCGDTIGGDPRYFYHRVSRLFFDDFRTETIESSMFLMGHSYFATGGDDDLIIEFAKEFSDIKYQSDGVTVDMFRRGAELTSLRWDSAANGNAGEYYGKHSSWEKENKKNGGSYDPSMGIKIMGFKGNNSGQFTFYTHENRQTDTAVTNYYDEGDFCLTTGCNVNFSLTAIAMGDGSDNLVNLPLNPKYYNSNLKRFTGAPFDAGITVVNSGSGIVETFDAIGLGATSNDFSMDCLYNDNCSSGRTFYDLLEDTP